MPPLTIYGRDTIAAQILGESTPGIDFNSTNSKLVVGDSTGAFASSDIDLGSTGANRAYKAMDGTYPQRAVNVLTFRSTFTTTEANFAWNEWAVKNTSATSSGTGGSLNRKQEALGTKTSAQSWQLTGTLTVTT